ncbi:MAG: 3-deoxy-7-phosphoheptulonate synthase, partial [Spirochaetaceae bacterium]|nr:3-deoxy-7-phosphoheptulonate synthase [Spirochaetaceae bacterium]
LWRYWADCLSWSAIGARGVEAQALRETAAALPFPCGFKNDLAGSHDSALAAALVASKPCRFLGLGPEGRVAAIEAPGNPLPHLVLRGGRLRLPFAAGWSRPNYLAASSAIRGLEAAGLEPALVVDASHDNRRPFGQAFTARAALRLARSEKNAPRGGIRGLMLESNLEPGCQAPAPPASLRYGVSITDPCLGWEETEALILEIDARLRRRSPA